MSDIKRGRKRTLVPCDYGFSNKTCKQFGIDRNYGGLWITKYGDVVCFIGSEMMAFEVEKQGRNSGYEAFRWMDMATGERKKAYISKLLRDYFGQDLQ